MARDFLAEQARHENAGAVRQGIHQLHNAARQIKAVSGQLATLRSTLVAAVGGDYDQVDVDRFDALTAKVVALRNAAEAFLAGN